MNEINRLQQLAGILTEIKVNKPDKFSVLKRGLERVLEGDKEWTDDEDEIIHIDDSIRDIRNAEDEDKLRSILYDYLYNDKQLVNDYMEMALEKSESPFMKEDISGFNVGQTKQSDGHKSTVVDVNPETQSVTWDIKKDITDKEIHDDLSKIIRKFETVQVKDFHSRPKLIQLIKDLKTIRNKFSRTVVKEERGKLINKLGSLLNEIKISNPNKILQAKDIGDDEYDLYIGDNLISFGRLDDNDNLEIFFHSEEDKFQKAKELLDKFNIKYEEDEDHFDQFLYIPKKYIKFNI